jgi:hypothetical protein
VAALIRQVPGCPSERDCRYDGWLNIAFDRVLGGGVAQNENPVGTTSVIRTLLGGRPAEGVMSGER